MRARHAPCTVRVLPYVVEPDGEVAFAVFRPAGGRGRPWLSLGAEGAPGEPAARTARELAAWIGVPGDALWMALDSRAPAPGSEPPGAVVMQAFAVRVCRDEVRTARTPLEHHWATYAIAEGLLGSAADRDALFELRRRLGRLASCC